MLFRAIELGLRPVRLDHAWEEADVVEGDLERCLIDAGCACSGAELSHPAGKLLCSASMDPAGVGLATAVDGAGAWVSTEGAAAQPASATTASHAGTSQQRADAGKREGVCILPFSRFRETRLI